MAKSYSLCCAFLREPRTTNACSVRRSSARDQQAVEQALAPAFDGDGHVGIEARRLASGGQRFRKPANLVDQSALQALIAAPDVAFGGGTHFLHVHEPSVGHARDE